jgi:DNA-binding MarR family transcriptional regulator
MLLNCELCRPSFASDQTGSNFPNCDLFDQKMKLNSGNERHKYCMQVEGRTLTIWKEVIRANTRFLERLDRDLERHSDMSLAEFGVLAILGEAGDAGVRMTQLAEQALLSKSRLSHCVDRLVGLGWVQRARVPGDKRGLVASLTAEGNTRLRRAVPLHMVDVSRYFLDVVPPNEIESAYSIAKSVNAAIDAGD